MRSLVFRRIRRGDTLAEVAICTAIFAGITMGAIALTNSGLNTSQASLETTIARSEIDSQAEALRFVHEAYSAQHNLDAANRQYVNLWKSIVTNYMNKPEQIPVFNDVEYCDYAYDALEQDDRKAFILNPRQLSPEIVTKADSSGLLEDNVLLGFSRNKFRPTTIFPQILYKNGETDNTLYENLASNSPRSSISKAEGIWVMAACGDNFDNCDSKDTSNDATPPSFYDFYIRACWNPAGRDRPTTISTSIRLYNPDVKVESSHQDTYQLNYLAGAGQPTLESEIQTTELLGSYTFSINYGEEILGLDGPKKDANGNEMIFLGWSTDGTANSTLYNKNGDNKTITVTENNPNIKLYPVWGYKYQLIWDPNTSNPSAVRNLPDNDTKISASQSHNFGKVPDKTPVYSSGAGCYVFLGWSTSPNGSVNVSIGSQIIANASHPVITYYAIWDQVTCHDFQIRLTWGASPRDLDSHLNASGATSFHVYYSNKSGTGANLDRDVTSGYGPEIVTLDTRANSTYTYRVHCYSTCSVGSGAKVELINAREGDIIKTCTSTSAGNNWYVLTMTTNADNVPTFDYRGNNCR